MPNSKTEKTEKTSILSIFTTWGLSPVTLKAIEEIGYKAPTPVQEACIPYLMENEGDLIALARTGTGKTAAFGIPLIEKLEVTPKIQALVLCPTRELATQVCQSINLIGQFKGLKAAAIVGGESYRKQMDSLRAGPQIVVSTPGRLIDLLEQKALKLNTVKYLVLDEADEMLSFGFQEALETIWKSLEGGNATTWLFSATMSDSIRKLTSKYLDNPHQVALQSSGEPNNVESFAAVVFEEDKEDALTLLIQSEPTFYGIIFAQTKRQVGELEIKLRKMGLDVDSLHGDKVQAERTRTINRMKKKEVKILVATDVAARGLDIQDLTHVVNFELPFDVETYTHRIGRTARAGKKGTVWTFVKPKETQYLRKFERALKTEFKNLVIPDVDDVIKNHFKVWLESVHQTKVTPEYQKAYHNLFLDLALDDNMEMSDETKAWMIKVIQYMKVGSELSHRQPRNFELKKDSRGAFHGGGSSSGRPQTRNGGSRSYGRPVRDTREESGDRGGGRSYSSRPRRDDGGSRPADRRPSRDFAPRGEDSRPPRRDYAPRSEESRPRREYTPRSADAPVAPAGKRFRSGDSENSRPRTPRSSEGGYGGPRRSDDRKPSGRTFAARR